MSTMSIICSSSSGNKSSTGMLCYIVIMALIASFVLSVDAIRCHQCNSHLDEDCISLRLVTPRAPRDDQYLKECVPSLHPNIDAGEPFCRKVVTKIEITGEQRIVRNCGWMKSDVESQTECFTADNEGYYQTICNCKGDGCNGSTRFGSDAKLIGVGVLGCGLLLAAWLRRSF